MTKYKCSYCGHIFDDPVEITAEESLPRTRGHWDLKKYYRVEACPQCHADYFYTVEECPTCGEWTTDDFCEECQDKAMQALYKLQEELGTGWHETIGLMERVIKANW